MSNTNIGSYASKRHYTRSYETGRAGTTRIDLMTGELHHHFSDIICYNGKMPMGITHTYRNLSAPVSNPFGSGMHLSICASVSICETANAVEVTYTDGEGYTHFFTGERDENGNIIAYDAGGLGLTYYEGYAEIEAPSADESNTNEEGNLVYVRWIIDEKGNRLEFNAQGCMTRGVDTVGNAIAVEYNDNGFPISVQDGSGRTATLAYEGGMLRAIIDPTGLYTYYFYENGFLTAVVYCDDSLLNTTDASKPTYPVSLASTYRYGYEIYFAYDNNRIVSIADVKGKKHAFSYDANGRVAQVELLMCRVGYGAIGENGFGNGEQKARDTYTYYTGSACVTALSGLRRTYRLDENGYIIFTHDEAGSSGIGVDENAFTFQTHATRVLGNGTERPYTSMVAAGVPCNYDVNKNVTASADILGGSGRLAGLADGTTAFADFVPSGMGANDGIVSASPVFAKSYRITSSLDGEKKLTFTKNVSGISYPYNSFAFALRAFIDSAGLYPLAEDELFEVGLVLTYADGAQNENVVSLVPDNSNAQTAIVCAKAEAGKTLTGICASVRSQNARHTFYLTDLRLLSVPATVTEYTVLTDESITVANGTDTGLSVPVLYKKTVRDDKYITEEWYTEYEQCVKTAITDLSGNVFVSYAVYNDEGLLVRQENYRGIVTEYTYSDKGQVTQKKRYHKDTPGVYYSTQNTYTDEGYLATAGDPRSNSIKTSYTYDAADLGGRIRTETDPRGQCITYNYDYNNNDDNKGYGCLASVLTTTNAGQSGTRYGYVWNKQIYQNTASACFGTSYDGLDRIIADRINDVPWVEYTYNDTPAAPTVTVTYANEQKITLEKDARGSMKARRYTPSGSTVAATLLTSA